ncbi:MAG: MATE family efflux transporter [Bacilli bacterium]|nr:MATE family efflux transporter [Bacilli bacterium]
MLKSIRNLFKSRDMTTGNLFAKIILLAIPAMLATMAQLLYTTIDLATVSAGDGAESMGAIASNTALINLIIVVFTGTSLGANVILSEAMGAGNKEKASNVLHSSMLFALVSGIFVGVLGFFISDNLLELMGTEEHYFAKAALYLRIYFCGLPFLMLFNYAAQLLRAQGDSRSPFLALLISGLVNVGFDFLFVFSMHMGVAGVALATIIAEAISALICILFLIFSKKNYVNLSLKKLKIHSELLEVLKIGLPAGLQGFFFSLPNVFIQSSLYTIDPGNVNLENGATASGNVEGYFYAICDAIAVSTMTFIAANIGAKKKENIKKCAFYGLIWGAIFCAIIAVVILLFHRPILSLFVKEKEAIDAGYTRLSIMAYLYFFDFTMAYTAAVLRGLKRSKFPMFTTLICCTVLRIVLILTVFNNVEVFHTVFWLYMLFPITWVIATTCNCIALAVFMPKDLKKLELSEHTRE